MGHRKVRSPANLRGVSGVARSLGCSSCNQGELFLQNTEYISKFRNWRHHRLFHRGIDRFSYDLSSSAIFISAAATHRAHRFLQRHSIFRVSPSILSVTSARSRSFILPQLPRECYQSGHTSYLFCRAINSHYVFISIYL